MSNPSKDIGTRVESAVVKAALAVGIPATRPALAGAGDVGDVHLCYGKAVVECKGGKQAAGASMNLIRGWWAEAEREAARVTQCDLGILVVKRGGTTDPRQWRAFTTVEDYLWALDGIEYENRRLIEFPLGGLLDDLAAAGWATQDTP